MKRTYPIALVGALALLLCGCAGSRPEEAQTAAHLSKGDTVAFKSSTDSRSRLEGQGFTVLDFQARIDEYGRVYVVGEIRNTGSVARGVELQATLRDAAGRILAVGHFYPASHTSIRPGETWPFAYSFGKQEDAVQAELRIVGAFRTMDIRSVASVGR